MTSVERIESLDKKLKPNTEDTSEQRIREIVRKFFFDGKSNLKEDEMLLEIINLIKCDLKTAKAIVQKMKDLGLEVCTTRFIPGYSIAQFVKIRGYLSKDELQKLQNERDKAAKELEEEEKKLEQEFIEKHGSDKSKWSKEALDEYLENGVYFE